MSNYKHLTAGGSWDIHQGTIVDEPRMPEIREFHLQLLRGWCRLKGGTRFMELEDSWCHFHLQVFFVCHSKQLWNQTRSQQVGIWVFWGKRNEKNIRATQKKTCMVNDSMHCHDSSTRILSGFKSRWMMPLEWIYASLDFFRSQRATPKDHPAKKPCLPKPRPLWSQVLFGQSYKSWPYLTWLFVTIQQEGLVIVSCIYSSVLRILFVVRVAS